MTAIGTRFEAVRTALGLTRQGIAEKTGVKYDSWRRFEGGDLPNGATLERLWLLGISLDWLIGGEGQMRRGFANELREAPAEPDAPSQISHAPAAPRRLAPEEVEEAYRRMKAIYDEAVRLGGGWEPPRQTESGLLTLLFGFAVRDGAYAQPGAIVEFLARVRQDLERST